VYGKKKSVGMEVEDTKGDYYLAEGCINRVKGNSYISDENKEEGKFL